MVLHGLLQSVVAVLLQVGAVQIPQPVGVVNDFAHVIPADRAAVIEQIANDVRAKSRGELVVVTLSDLQGREPSELALQIGRQWKVGKIGNPGDPTRNAGAVILIVPKETSSDGHGGCFVATGSGAEGFITDAMAGTICRAAVPAFQARDYGTGITLVTYQVAQRFAQEFGFALDSTLRVSDPYAGRDVGGGGRGGIPPQLIFLAIVFIIMLLSSGRRGRRGCGCLPIFFPFPVGGGWSGGGGGFGGGFGSGGGGFGGFGGGGGFSGGGGGARW